MDWIADDKVSSAAPVGISEAKHTTETTSSRLRLRMLLRDLTLHVTTMTLQLTALPEARAGGSKPALVLWLANRQTSMRV